MEFVQVDRTSLLEYIAYVEHLNEDHTRLQQQNKDLKEVSKILEATYNSRIDKLLDLILEQPNRADYYKGLQAAYNIIMGRAK